MSLRCRRRARIASTCPSSDHSAVAAASKRQRRARGAVEAHAIERGEDVLPRPTANPERSPAALERLDSEWSTSTLSSQRSRGIDRREHVQRARRRRVVVELGVALVEDDEEVVPARRLDRPPHLAGRDHAPVRIRRRAQVENRRARPRAFVDRGEVEREFRKSAVGEIARLRARHDRRRPVGLIERVLHHGERRRARRTGRDRRREVETLAAARDRRDLRVGIDPAARPRIAALEIAHAPRAGTRACRPPAGSGSTGGHGRRSSRPGAAAARPAARPPT